MKNKLHILIILSNILFASQWTEYQSHLISNNRLVIKLEEIFPLSWDLKSP